ncbi:MAG TPA: 1,4-dihydroxy-2-naphthoate polyprenyltransferase [Cytophagales bacterium]|nr:1,4-dihydroxy-2-naphthoate polyprenyltransferase [Cytophagales bacterium]
MNTQELKIGSWIQAFRLRTLPLALSSIGMGGFLAASHNAFSPVVFLFCCLTTLLLQILSNLANDYGDYVHGADHLDRKGPKRMVQSGQISLIQMKSALFLFTFLSLVSGLFLLYTAFGFSSGFLIFLVLGILAIVAAITYTAGNKPYGYAGLGDLSVLLFFGPVGVLGTYYLQAREFSPAILLPAISCGLFAVAVLNLNNIRDIESDKAAGKMSVPVRLGRNKAVLYHWILLTSGISLTVFYTLNNYRSPFQFIFLIVIPLLLINGRAVKRYTTSAQLDPYLKQMALTTLLFVLSFGAGNLLS